MVNDKIGGLFPFTALTLLIGQQEEHQPDKRNSFLQPVMMLLNSFIVAI